MKIPKYRDIDSQIRKIDVDDLFNLLMSDLATHDIKSALEDMVVYIKKSGIDLSKELLDLSKHPTDSKVITHVAKKVCRIQNKKFLKYVKNQMKKSSKSNASSEHKNLPSDYFMNDSDATSHFKKSLIDLLKNHSFLSLNLIGVDSSGQLVSVGADTPETVSSVNLGLDALKTQLIHDILSNEGRHGDGPLGGNHFGGPNKPTPEDPVDQAVDIINKLDL